MLNDVKLQGRMTREPELRQTQSGKSVCGFSLAVKGNGKDAPTDFFDCVAWGNTAEFVSRYFSKGALMIVSGRLQTREWQDQNGAKRKSVEVVVNDAYFCESKQKQETPYFAEEDEELPFE